MDTRFELLFYILIAAVVVLRGPVLWAGVPVLLSTLLPAHGRFGPTLMIEFIYGLVAYFLWQRGKLVGPMLPLAVAALTFAIPLSEARFIAWGIPAALIFFVMLEGQPENGIIDRKAKWVGQISYSLYLSHVVTFDAIAPIFGQLGPLSLGIILAVTGILVAWLV